MLALTYCSNAFGQQDFQEVDPRNLVRNPKNYWSLGVIFRDTLVDSEAGHTMELGDKLYYPIRTENANLCYVDADIADQLETLSPGREYLFRGTVLNRQATFFNRQEFFVVIQKITRALDSMQDVKAILDRDTLAAEMDDNSLLADIYEDIFAYAEAQGIAMRELLSPDSSYRPQVVDIINGQILRKQSEGKTTVLAMMSDMIYEILAEYKVQEEPAEPVSTSPGRIGLKPGFGQAPPPTRTGGSTVATNTAEKKPTPPEKPKPKLLDGVGNYNAPVGW
jgi:hypothetical protein